MIVYLLDARPQLQHVRRPLAHVGGVAAISAAVEESWVRAIEEPVVSHRRVTIRTAEVGETTIPSGEPALLNWTAANRDPGVTGAPSDLTSPVTPPRT